MNKEKRRTREKEKYQMKGERLERKERKEKSEKEEAIQAEMDRGKWDTVDEDNRE